MDRYLFVYCGLLLGDPSHNDPRGMLLAEQDDGSWLSVDARGDGGEALKEFHRRFPGMIQEIKDHGPDEWGEPCEHFPL